MKTTHILFSWLCLFSGMSFAQQPADFSPAANYYQITQKTDSAWLTRPKTRGSGFNPYQRWADYAGQRVFPSGNMTYSSHLAAVEAFQEKYSLADLAPNSTRSYQNANWQPVGPFGNPNGGQAGRVSFLRIHPTNLQIMYAGTPNGGLWKSTDGGSNWTCLTDQHAVIGCSDLVINYNNPQVLYLATGDGTSSDCYTLGVLKSIDGGTTWTATNFTRTAQQQVIIRKLLMHPTNPLELIMATNQGFFRTINGGNSWQQSLSNELIKDIAYKPGSPSTIYIASSNKFYVFNGTFNQITSGLPAPAQVNKYAIGVTPHDPNYVYLIASDGGGGPTNDGLKGVYRSTNGGMDFTLQAASPNILCQNATGTGPDGQGSRNCCVLVSPFNKNELIVGGINTWYSNTSGTTWTLNTHVDAGNGVPEVHADCFEIILPPGAADFSTYYLITDGGIYKKAGTNFITRNGQMNIAQVYRVGVSSWSTALVTGHQDNGSYVKTPQGGFTKTTGSDGTDCFMSQHHDSVCVFSTQNGNFRLSRDYGATTTMLQNGLPASKGLWVSPIAQNPLNNQILYCGGWEKPYIMRNLLAGNDWNSFSVNPLNSNAKINSIAVAWADTSVVYASTENSIHRTTNSGQSWNNISTPNLPFQSSKLTDIAVSRENRDLAFICFSSYANPNEKVFVTTNGGNTWQNLTKTGLPNQPYNTIVINYHIGTNDIYIGGDVGVYYTNDTLSSWILFSDGLPNTSITDLEISSVDGSLCASTYGRGVWKTPQFAATNRQAIAEAKQPVGVYPNPAQNEVTLSFGSVISVNNIRITDLNGKTVMELQPGISTHLYNLNCSPLTQGIYMIGVNDRPPVKLVITR